MYAAVDKKVSAAYRDTLIKCYGLEYENFNVCFLLEKLSITTLINKLLVSTHLTNTTSLLYALSLCNAQL